VFHTITSSFRWQISCSSCYRWAAMELERLRRARSRCFGKGSSVRQHFCSALHFSVLSHSPSWCLDGRYANRTTQNHCHWGSNMWHCSCHLGHWGYSECLPSMYLACQVQISDLGRPFQTQPCTHGPRPVPGSTPIRKSPKVWTESYRRS